MARHPGMDDAVNDDLIRWLRDRGFSSALTRFESPVGVTPERSDTPPAQRPSRAPPMLPIPVPQGAVSPDEMERAWAAQQARAAGMQASLTAQTAALTGGGGGSSRIGDYLQSEGTKLWGGYDPRTDITWKTGRQGIGNPIATLGK